MSAIGRPDSLRERALLDEIESLKGRLLEPEATVAAIRFGEVDAFVVAEGGGERVYVLKDAADAAAEDARRDADRHKDEFLAMLGHELRGPLAAIASSIQVFERLAPPEPRLQRAREVIDRQVTHLSRMVDDLLDVSRVATGKLDLRLEAVDLAALVSRVAESHRPRFEERSHVLTVDVPAEPVPVQADPTRLAQVLANLLDNALKYTPEGGRVSVALSAGGSGVSLRVRDTGIGIAPEALPAIFDLFNQGSQSRETSRGGLGIGLALARRLVELQDGRITARSEGLGLGSEFEVSLPPLFEPAPPATGPAAPPAMPAAPRRILVVDDHVDSADALAALLGLAGHEVRTAHDGPSALDAASEFRPDAILLDIGLPGMDGYEAGRRLRETLGDEVVIVAVTGYGQDEDRRRSAEARFDHHALKPVPPETIASLLEKRRAGA